MSSGANSTARSKWKTPLFVAVVVLTNAFGNFFIARGMRRPELGAPLDILAAIFTPWVTLGIMLFVIAWLSPGHDVPDFADLVA